MGSSLVNPLVLGLLGLHLQTTTNGVKRIRSIPSGDGGSLGNSELGGNTHDSVVGLERIHLTERVVHSEVNSSVGDDTDNGDTEAVVETQNSLGTTGSLDKAVRQTVEVTLSVSDIRGQTGTGIIERVHNDQASSSGSSTRGHLNKEKLPKLSLGVVSREHLLEGILEGKVEGLGGDVTDNVGQVSTPEGSNTLLRGDTREAVDNAGVAGNLTRTNARVGILGLDDQLHTLDRSSDGLGDTTRDTTDGEVDEKVEGTCCFVCHGNEHERERTRTLFVTTKKPFFDCFGIMCRSLKGN